MKKVIIALLLSGTMLITISGRAFAADDAASKAESRRLFRQGAQLWGVYCNTCHNARPGAEKAPYEWDAIMMHMRTLGNFPAKDYQAILAYLKAR